jgi:hypothetical protein
MDAALESTTQIQLPNLSILSQRMEAEAKVIGEGAVAEGATTQTAVEGKRRT